MKITRLDSERSLNKDVETIQIELSNGNRLTITEYFDDLKIHAHREVLIVKPCCSNEILIESKD